MRLFAPNPTSDALHRLAARGLSEAAGDKPLLLRVLTDLFVMRPTHSADEIRQFAEIALRLLPEATAAECEHAATALCDHLSAPTGLMDRLAQRFGDGALQLYARCRALSTNVLEYAAAAGDEAVGVALAGRSDLGPGLISMLASREEIAVLRALARNSAAPLAGSALTTLIARARSDFELAFELIARAPHRPETLALFMHADNRRRAMMIARTRENAGETEPLSQALEHGAETTLRRLEAIALEGARDEFAEALATACRCSEDLARAIVADLGGEPLTIALRSLGLRAETVTRIFLSVDPQVAHVQGRVSALARLAESLSQDVAKRIFDAMSGRQPTTTRHVTLHDQTARLSTARQGQATIRKPRSVAELLKRPA
jgi:uncharacterized protein (DUF2336 family)